MIVEPFLDINIIKEKSDNINIIFNKPTREKIVLSNTKEYEGECNGYYTILYDFEYKLYYRAVNHNVFKNAEKTEYYTSADLQPYECFCLATSKDGLNFEKNDLYTYNYKGSTNNNILKFDNFCHNFFPYYVKDKNIYYGLSGTEVYNNGLYLFESCNGINWNIKKKIMEEKDLIPNWKHINHFDSLSNIVYNKNDNYYYIYVRDNKESYRFVQYIKTNNFVEFTKSENIIINKNDIFEIYAQNIYNYPNSNYLISIPTTRHNHPKYDSCYYFHDIKKADKMMVSKDGHNWKIITNNIFNNIDNDNNTFSVNGMVQSVDNKKLYIYNHEDFGTSNNNIVCYSFEYNRLMNIYCDSDGHILTNPIYLDDYNITINCLTKENGYIVVYLINENNNVVMLSDEIYNNSIDYHIKWISPIDNFKKGYYNIKFRLINSHLFSFSYYN